MLAQTMHGPCFANTLKMKVCENMPWPWKRASRLRAQNQAMNFWELPPCCMTLTTNDGPTSA